MSRRQLPRTTAAILDAATFLPGEIAVDTTNDELRYDGDGSTVGGIKVAKKSDVTALQALTANLGTTPISTAMAPVVQAATLAAGRSALAVPGLGDSNAFTAHNTFPSLWASKAVTALPSDIGGVNYTVNGFRVTADNIDNGSGFVQASTIYYVFGGSSVKGGRIAGKAFIANNAITNAANANRHYVGFVGESYTAVGDGGTNTGAGALGRYYGGNFLGRLDPGATNVEVNTGVEINTVTAVGSSVRYNLGVFVSGWNAVRGAEVDAAYAVSGDSTMTGWKHTWLWTDIGAGSPVYASTVLFGHYWLGGGTKSVATGIDLTGFSFSGNAYQSNGYSVDGSGNVTAANITTTGSINLGHASDTTLARSGAGDATIEGNIVYRAGGTDVAVADGGTGSSTASGARTNLGFADGTYTPTLTGVANVDALTAYACQYMRVGNTVTVSGRYDLDPTAGASTWTRIRMTLPIASALAVNNQLGGVTFGYAGAENGGGAILADSTNDEAEISCYPVYATNQAWYFTFTYLVV